MLHPGAVSIWMDGWDGMDHRVGWGIEHKYGANKWSFIYYVIHFVPNKDLTTINDRHSAVNWVANDILQFYSETQMNHWSARKLPCCQQGYLGSSVDSDQHIAVLYFFVNKKSNYQWQRSLAGFWHVARVALSCSDTVEIRLLWTSSGDVKSSCWSQEGFLSRVVASGKLWISWIGLIWFILWIGWIEWRPRNRETQRNVDNEWIWKLDKCKRLLKAWLLVSANNFWLQKDARWVGESRFHSLLCSPPLTRLLGQVHHMIHHKGALDEADDLDEQAVRSIVLIFLIHWFSSPLSFVRWLLDSGRIISRWSR